MIHFPEDISSAQTICALRFLGYEYMDSLKPERPGEGDAGFGDLIGPICRSLILHEDQNRNFAAFFCLQRGLHKWGGEHSTKHHPDHLAYDFLFLHLYRFDPPAEFTHPQYAAQWRRDHAAQAEATAGFVRKSFRRAGRGPKNLL